MISHRQTKTALAASERIRIAHVMFSLEPGGLENGVVNLSNGLDPDRFETVVYCLEQRGEFASRLRRDVRVCSLEKSGGFSFSTIFRLVRRIRRDRPDVLHTHNLGPLIYGVVASALSGTRVPVLHGEHGVFREEDRSSRRLVLRRLLYRYCRQVHTVSESLREYLVEIGLPSRNLVAVLNGVDCERFHPPGNKGEAKASLGLPREAEVIGMVGRLIPSKRHGLVLEAFETVAKSCDRAFLLFVGDGGSEREPVAEAIRDHPFGDRIRWVGHQSDPLPFYQAMDLLVMPSSVEGLSNALLEAMACGVPCLAHPACGASEVIAGGSNGELREMENPEQVASGLVDLLRDPGYTESMGRHARETAEKRFSLSGMIGAYGKLYEDIYRD